MRYGSVVVACLFIFMAGGCSSSLAHPNWFNPGPTAYQQKQAERFDPYPDDTLGPTVEGGRPREYDRPREPLPLRPNPYPPAAYNTAPAYAPAAYSSAAAAAPAPFMPYNQGTAR